MTCVTFYRAGGSVTGFDVAGHTGFAREGEDIVCAAVTSAVRLVECTLNDVMNLGAHVQVDPDTAFISLGLPDARANAAQDVLSGMIAYLRQLENEYPGFVKIREVL